MNVCATPVQSIDDLAVDEGDVIQLRIDWKLTHGRVLLRNSQQRQCVIKGYPVRNDLVCLRPAVPKLQWRELDHARAGGLQPSLTPVHVKRRPGAIARHPTD